MAYAQSGGSTGRQMQPISGSQRAKQQPPISFNLNVSGSWRNGLTATPAAKPKTTLTATQTQTQSKSKSKIKIKGKIKEKGKSAAAALQQTSPLELLVVGHRLTMRPITMRLGASLTAASGKERSVQAPARTALQDCASKQEHAVRILEADEFLYVYNSYPMLDLWPGEDEQPQAVIDARFLAELFDELIIGVE